MLVEERLEIGEFSTAKVNEKARINKESSAKEVIESSTLEAPVNPLLIRRYLKYHPKGALCVFSALFKSLAVAS